MQMRKPAYHQHWQHRDVPELARDAASQNIGEPAMAVSRHSDQIAVLTLRARRNLLGGITTSENCFGAVSVSLERLGDAFDVLAVAPHFFRLAKVELVDVARRPSVGDVYQHERGVVARARQLPDVIQNHIIVGRVLDGNEYALIHQLTDPRNS